VDEQTANERYASGDRMIDVGRVFLFIGTVAFLLGLSLALECYLNV